MSHALKVYLAPQHDEQDDSDDDVCDVKQDRKCIVDPLEAFPEKIVSAEQELIQGEMQFLQDLTKPKPPDEMFDQETQPTLWQMRQTSLVLQRSTWWHRLCCSVLVAHIVIMVISSESTSFTPKVSHAIQSTFCAFYWVECAVFWLGWPHAPWEHVTLWVDLILVLITSFDLWIFALLDYFGVVTRPHLSFVVVFRLSKIATLVREFAMRWRGSRPVEIFTHLSCSPGDLVVSTVCFILSYFTFSQSS